MIIGIDAGYGYVKTKNTSFSAGVAHLSNRPPILKRVVEYEGNWYQVGAANDGIIDDKTSNIDYYILTLAGIAEEMKLVGTTDAEVVLAVGVPLMRYGAEKEPLVKYLSQNEQVDFSYEGVSYNIRIFPQVYVFPQGYAALVNRMDSINGPCYLVDMGTGTTEIMFISADKIADLSKTKTLQFGINNCIASINSRISNDYNIDIPEDSIIELLKGNKDKTGLPKQVIEVCEEVIREFAIDTMKLLKQNKVSYEMIQTFFIGGGAGIIEKYGNLTEHQITFIKDIRVNAVGYEALAKAQDSRY